MALISLKMWRRIDTLQVCHLPPIDVGDQDLGFTDHVVPEFCASLGVAFCLGFFF